MKRSVSKVCFSVKLHCVNIEQPPYAVLQIGLLKLKDHKICITHFPLAGTLETVNSKSHIYISFFYHLSCILWCFAWNRKWVSFFCNFTKAQGFIELSSFIKFNRILTAIEYWDKGFRFQYRPNGMQETPRVLFNFAMFVTPNRWFPVTCIIEN